MPSSGKLKTRKRRADAVKPAAELEAGDDDPNAVMLGPKKKKVKKAADEKQTKYNLKRRAMKERKEAKLTKKARKQLAAVAKRKEDRQTRDELLEELYKVQLDPSESAKLASVTQLRRKKHGKTIPEKESFVISDEKDVGELRVVKQKIRVAETIHNRARVQEGYYSTGSEEEDEDEEEEAEAEKDEKMDDREVQATNPEVVKAPETPVEAAKVEETKPQLPLKQSREVDDDLPAISSSATNSKAPTGLKPIVVETRDPEIEVQRQKLPIYKEEQPIVEAIHENLVTVVNGETGSGKTTQIPQFLYEAGYTALGMIGITEPRRVAAVSMAKRVGVELGQPDIVSYQIRFEGTRTDETKILFMTDGVLMKEMQTDVMLKKYSVLIIDEAHERSMYSDVLIGMLSRIVCLRADTNPLKLIIMSATLRTADFTHKKLFPALDPRILSVESRQFPVTLHFEKRTPADFLKAAFNKACRIHEELPAGAMLIFVPGQADVKQLIKKLTARYPVVYETSKDGQKLIRGSKQWKEARERELKNMKLEDFKENSLAPPPANCEPLYCLPLYSLLSSEKQRRVFQDSPPGTRLCVVATNVAETSITIPGVRYVVDSGFEKQRRYDPVTGVSQFVLARCSQASADQRSGRAGRVSAGHAYRLYSSQVYQDCQKFSRPEILDKPADQLVLHLKSMNIVKVVNFPFPSTPDEDALIAAEERLIKMEALSVGTRNEKTEARITALGKSLAVFPLAPAYAKVVAMANQHGLMPYAIALIAALSVREPMVNVATLRGSTEAETKQHMVNILKLRRSWLGKNAPRRLGDLGVLLRAVSASEKCEMIPDECDMMGMRYKAMLETSDGRSPGPDRIAKRVDQTTAEEVPKGAYQCQSIKEYVFIDQTSMHFMEEPDYVLYQEITQNVMSVDEEWLYKLAENYCTPSAPPADNKGVSYNPKKDALTCSVSVAFGPCAWDLGTTERPLPHNINTYRLFAQCLLAGQVIPALAEWTPKLLAPPTTMTREWAKLQPRTEAVLNALIRKETLSRAALNAVWTKEPEFLLDEVQAWLPQTLHTKFQAAWPPVDAKEAGRK
ncbi:unnamed protein product, partial [Mesorhabditis spiculigera]